jgi:hypothetical protein
MKLRIKLGAKHVLAIGLLCGLSGGAAFAQDPVVVGTAAAIAIQTIKPKKQSPYPKFEGTVINANNVIITVRGKENELAVQTFTLSQEARGRRLSTRAAINTATRLRFSTTRPRIRPLKLRARLQSQFSKREFPRTQILRFISLSLAASTFS